MSHKTRVLSGVILLLGAYLISYIAYRQASIEVWERNGTEYVIFSEDKILYYVYRPLSIIDARLTGMQFHIGPHENGNN